MGTATSRRVNGRRFRIWVLALALAGAFSIGSATWAIDWPNDPPSGDDWDDFGWTVGLMYLDNGSPAWMYTRAVTIDIDNPNFRSHANESYNDDKVVIIHVEEDYGASQNVPTKAQGLAYWNYLYRGYSPAPTVAGSSEATYGTNCLAFAFNGFRSGDVVSNWSNPGQYWDIFIGMTGYTDVSYEDLASGDVGYGESHGWKISVCEPSPLKLTHHFKNGASPIYYWENFSPSSSIYDTPEGAEGGVTLTLRITVTTGPQSDPPCTFAECVPAPAPFGERKSRDSPPPKSIRGRGTPGTRRCDIGELAHYPADDYAQRSVCGSMDLAAARTGGTLR